MWAWISGKLTGVFAFIGVAIIIVTSLLRQGQQKEEIKNEKEKAKEQNDKHEKEIEIIRKVENVKNENILASDSTVISRLRGKWQRN